MAAENSVSVRAAAPKPILEILTAGMSLSNAPVLLHRQNLLAVSVKIPEASRAFEGILEIGRSSISIFDYKKFTI